MDNPSVKKTSGKILKENKELELKSVSQAIENGIAYVTEDRKNYGLILINSVKIIYLYQTMIK